MVLVDLIAFKLPDWQKKQQHFQETEDILLSLSQPLSEFQGKQIPFVNTKSASNLVSFSQQKPTKSFISAQEILFFIISSHHPLVPPFPDL